MLSRSPKAKNGKVSFGHPLLCSRDLFYLALRFADIDGDGRDDLLYLVHDSGTMYAWKNLIGGVDNSFVWNSKGMVAGGGTVRGSAIELANINGIGRADYITIDPVVNKAWVFL